MAAKDLGTKYICFKCGTKFYDLKKPDPRCPKCGADQRDSPTLKSPAESKRGRPAPVPKVVEPVESDEIESIEEEELENFEEEEPEIPDEEDL
jgi:uncharacterized protein (TIGR02300 family)